MQEFSFCPRPAPTLLGGLRQVHKLDDYPTERLMEYDIAEFTPEMNLFGIKDLQALGLTDIEVLPHYRQFLTEIKWKSAVVDAGKHEKVFHKLQKTVDKTGCYAYNHLLLRNAKIFR